MCLHSKIKSLRLSKELTQREFAIAVGISHGYMHQIENEHHNISSYVLNRISRVFDVPMEHLLEGE